MLDSQSTSYCASSFQQAPLTERLYQTHFGERTGVSSSHLTAQLNRKNEGGQIHSNFMHRGIQLDMSPIQFPDDLLDNEFDAETIKLIQERIRKIRERHQKNRQNLMDTYHSLQ